MSSAPQMQMNRLLKLTLYAKRKEGMTEQEFREHWTDKHRPLVSEWLLKHGIVRYAQVSRSEEA